MSAAESGWTLIRRAVSLVRANFNRLGVLPDGPQYVLQHLERMQQQSDREVGLRSDASRVALLRDLEEPAVPLRPGE